MKNKSHIIRLLLMLYVLFQIQYTQATLTNFWFTGYHYDARVLFSKSASEFAVKPLSLEQSVDLANLMYLRQSYDSMNLVIASAISDCKRANDWTAVYQLYNFKVERNQFAGRYLYAEKQLKQFLKQVPSSHKIYPFLKLNRIKLLAKTFQLQGGILPQIELDSLKKQFERLGAYNALIETFIFDYSKNEMMVNIDDYVKLMKHLPEPYNQIGLMNMYYQARSQLRDVAILNKVSDIPPSFYLDYFRFHIARATEYINIKDSASASRSLTLAYQSIANLGDIEVKRHYTGVYKDFIVFFEAPPFAPKPLVRLDEYDYQGKLLASNEIAKDLLMESNKALKEEQLMNVYFKVISIVISLVLSIVLAFYLRAHSLLKRANRQRQWFVTALSHDLRSPLAQIARSIDESKDPQYTKQLLVKFEYLLNDTMEMAVDTQFKDFQTDEIFDLQEIVENTLLDLDFIVKYLTISVNNQVSDELILTGNKNGFKIILRNLLLNAMKHNVQNGYISLTVSSEEPYILTIENSMQSKVTIDHQGTGTHLIEYFAKQNKMQYQLHLSEGIAQAQLLLRK